MNAPVAAAGTDADRIAVATLSCPAVARLHGGRFGEVATYLPGRRIGGVRLRSTPDGDAVEIHVVGRYPATVAEVAGQVRAVLKPIVGSARVDVVVGDYAGEIEHPSAERG
ncbi:MULTISPECIES: hypothetical protein [Pseudonocardia]|uniref:Asp23/Gls24 family envelope stress response protein n=2 Tax=Pseudonocardia TaxID=1847 RepID=A0A1Y2MXH4_PSEAH|nr:MULTISPECIES: hypothetical protein [Pseudonocardia]OSY39914.1 hypothetical protein BG845_03149 [Pseudonocardia autotrophica]TDN74510.1 hypothetical protein C8E95_3633 [Pseudonocardia autotrophica]BBG05278.1 hypothetical protein Pdca_64870 [Pseudonocardia autotrophica]GEC28852.1 hypothetical protein PSA01_58810 [Pseudonocardia saturnea]